MALLRAVQHAAWWYSAGPFLNGVAATSPVHRVVVLVIAGIFGGMTVWLVRRSLHGRSISVDRSIWSGDARLPLWQTAATAAVSMTIVGLGVALGRERSVKQAGALAGSKLADLAGLSDQERRVLTALGSAAGMGAVYNMPAGGALYGLEVLLGEISLRLAAPAIVLAAIATAVSWIVLPGTPTYHVPVMRLWYPQLLWTVLAGPVIGALAQPYVRLVALARTHAAKDGALVIVPIAIFAALGAAAIAYPQLLGNGKDVVQLAFTGAVTGGTLAALIFLRPLAMAFSLFAGMPGGLFTPTLTVGALLGAGLGTIWNFWWNAGAPIGTYAIIGAGAMVAAAAQAPISAVVMLTELTGTINPLIVPLALACASAAAVARAFGTESIYTEHS